MATILILCGRSAVFTGPADDKADEDISLEELAVEGFNGERLSERVFLAAISSALFSSRGARRFGFAHQTLAECLTAEMLQKMEFRQALSLLCATDNGQIHVIPQLSETAAWLAGERDDFLNYLVQRDPVALLRSDISKVSDETKTALVHSLLDGAKKEEVFDVTEYRTFYRSLNHPGLAAQLRPIITDKQLNQVARRMAIDIAEACRIVELSNECLAVVQDTSDLLHIRENCAHALEEILPANLLPVLEALAFGQFPPDGDDSIRGSAIRRLIPEQWSVSKALKALRPPQNRNLFGAYHATLEYHLPKNIQVAEVPKLLCWLALRRDCFDHLSWSRSIADRTLLLALQNLQVPAIRSAAARIWLRKLKHHSALPDSDRFESFKLLRDSDDVRREFVRAIVEHPRCSIDDIRFLGGYQINLLLAQDLRWALDHLNKTRALRDRWSAVISEIFWTDRLTAEWDYFLDTLEQVPELKAALPWVRAWQLDEQVAKDAKSRHLKEREWKERIKRNQPSKTVRELLEDALALSEKEIVQGWCQLASSMELDDGPHGRGRSRNHDLRTCPGWQLLTSAEQDRVPSLAERFLLELGSRQQIPAAMEEAIYQAVWLLLPRIAESEPLAQVIAAKCLPALLRRFNSHNEYQITCVLAAALNRQEVLRHFKKRFEQKAQRDDGDLYGLVDFEKVWAEDFGAILTDILRRSTTQAATLQSGFTFFASVDAAAALQLATEMLSKTTLQTDPKASIIAGLLYSAPSEAWPIFEGACADEDIARNVLMRIATQLDHHGRQILPRLTEKQLGYLYLTMKRLFPFDEPPDSEDSTVTPERAIVWFRNDVLSTLAARSNANAVEELTNLGNAFPKERLWLRWRARDARTGLRMAQWLPPSPEHLLRLIREGSSRFVKDENDLLELVIESLDRLQTRLTRQANPRAEDLWQWDGADGKRHNFSPKEENFLSNYIAESLKQDLEARALFVGRELQLRPSQRTDIHIAATALPSNGGTPLDRLDLVVEVKGSWNPEVPTALESQLVSRYLRPNGYTYGIYIIGFYSCSKYGIDKTGCSSLENLRVTAQGWASSFDGRTRPETVRAFVLDCRYQG
jgi:hypothetical protein